MATIWRDQAVDLGGVAVFLARHGQTAWNKEHRFLGTSDVPLDDTGRVQAADLAAQLGHLPFAAVYSSPLARARQTAEAVSARVEVVPDLRELAQGDLEGLDAPTAIGRYPAFFEQWRQDPTGLEVPGGERLDHCATRVRASLEAIAARHAPGETVLVVSHQLAIASSLVTLMGEPLRRWYAFGLPNVAFHVLGRDAAGWTLLTRDRVDDRRAKGRARPADSGASS